MVERRIPLGCGDEHDAFSRRWRRMLGWRAGTLKSIKNGYRRRLRRAHRRELNQELAGEEGR